MRLHRFLFALTAALALAATLSCGLDEVDLSPDAEHGLVHGRLTDVEGVPLAEVTVEAGAEEARTDSAGRFTVRAPRGEARLRIRSARYTSASMPVTVGDDDAHVELAALPRKTLMLRDAGKGGRVEAVDGFAVTLPPRSLQRKDGSAVTGDVEVRYALVAKPQDAAALPGRMQAKGKVALEGYSAAEVRFYQDHEELELRGKAGFELPLVADHGLTAGKPVASYGLTDQDTRWQKADPAMVADDRVMLESKQGKWLSVAKTLPADSCVRGRLSTAKAAAVNTTIRAARTRGLSLVQGESGADGSFCLPLTPDDDWEVSAYYEDVGGKSRRVTLELSSREAVGMCGGDGCKKVGDLTLRPL